MVWQERGQYQREELEAELESMRQAQQQLMVTVELQLARASEREDQLLHTNALLEQQLRGLGANRDSAEKHSESSSDQVRQAVAEAGALASRSAGQVQVQQQQIVELQARLQGAKEEADTHVCTRHEMQVRIVELEGHLQQSQAKVAEATTTIQEQDVELAALRQESKVAAQQPWFDGSRLSKPEEEQLHQQISNFEQLFQVISNLLECNLEQFCLRMMPC